MELIVELTKDFRDSTKRLKKMYRNIKKDIQDIIFKLKKILLIEKVCEIGSIRLD